MGVCVHICCVFRTGMTSSGVSFVQLELTRMKSSPEAEIDAPGANASGSVSGAKKKGRPPKNAKDASASSARVCLFVGYSPLALYMMSTTQAVINAPGASASGSVSGAKKRGRPPKNAKGAPASPARVCHSHIRLSSLLHGMLLTRTTQSDTNLDSSEEKSASGVSPQPATKRPRYNNNARGALSAAMDEEGRFNPPLRPSVQVTPINFQVRCI